MYKTESGIDWSRMEDDILFRSRASLELDHGCPLAIDRLVWGNTAAKETVDQSSYQRNSYLGPFDNGKGFFPYDKPMPQLKKMLEKRLEAERCMDAQDRRKREVDGEESKEAGC